MKDTVLQMAYILQEHFLNNKYKEFLKSKEIPRCKDSLIRHHLDSMQLYNELLPNDMVSANNAALSLLICERKGYHTRAIRRIIN